MLKPDTMNKKKLQIEQIENKIRAFAPAREVTPPPTGWIKAIRLALGASQQQVGRRLSITRQSVHEIEKREKDGSITLNSLRETASAMDMKLVYALVPKDGSLEALIERRARELAEKIVKRTSNTMELEDQKVSSERIMKAIEDRAAILKHEMPKILWD